MFFSVHRPIGCLALGALLAGCAAGPPLEHVGRSFAPAPASPDLEDDDAEAKAPAEPAEPPPDDIVQQAALPFRGQRSSDGAELGPEALFSELARADAICVGERHGNAPDHFAQLTVLEALAARREIGGFELALGLEMFQKPAQPWLDAFGAGRIDFDELLRQSRFSERWGVPSQYYAPQLQTAQEAGLPILALNAPSDLTRAVAKEGLDELERELADQVPELNLDDAAHRALFDRMMEGHPPGGAADNMYAAQVVWDETMAEAAATWLSARAPARKLVILAGRAHCAKMAIPARIERRGRLRVVSVLPEVRRGEAPPNAGGNNGAVQGSAATDAAAGGAAPEGSPGTDGTTNSAEREPRPAPAAQSRRAPDATVQAPEDPALDRELAASYDYRFVMYAR